MHEQSKGSKHFKNSKTYRLKYVPNVQNMPVKAEQGKNYAEFDLVTNKEMLITQDVDIEQAEEPLSAQTNQRQADNNQSTCPCEQGSCPTEDNDNYDKITKSNYKSYVFNTAPKSSHFKNMAFAFLIGGLICTFGQLLIEGFLALNFDDETASSLASSTLIALAALATGLGIYDKLGRFAGAGSTIPITGFSNAMVSPAIEFKSEGLIYGLGAKMFVVAGPVVVNGVLLSVIIALLATLFGS